MSTPEQKQNFLRLTRMEFAVLILILGALCGFVCQVKRENGQFQPEEMRKTYAQMLSTDPNDSAVAICVHSADEQEKIYGEVQVSMDPNYQDTAARGVEFKKEDYYCKRFEVFEGINFLRVSFAQTQDISVIGGGMEKRKTVKGTAMFPIYVSSGSFEEPLVIRTRRER